MNTFSLRDEDRLEGPSNFVQCKCQIQKSFEHDLWDFVEPIVVEPTNPMFLVKHEKNMVKMKKGIPNFVKG